MTKTAYYNLEDIANRMGWCPKKVQRMIKHESFPATKLGREYMITEENIRKWENSKNTCQ